MRRCTVSMRRVHAERQAVAGGVDRIQHLVQPIRGVAHDVQHRPEYLASAASPRCRSSVRRAARRSCRARCPAAGQREQRRAHAVRRACSSDARASSSITGPTSVAGSSGSPITSVSAAPCSMRSTRSAMSSCRHSSRSAEQRWPAEPNALASTSATTCSGSAELSTIIALMPPVSAMNGTIGPGRAASDAGDRPAPSRCRR